MKKCIDAVRYGMETLGVSPDTLFSLIESSKGYDGAEYDRWLAGKIIEVSEKDGVGFSQLLVKKFEILSELMSSGDIKISDEFLIKFSEELGIGIKDLYTVGFSGYDVFDEEKKLDDYDLFNLVDLGGEEENYFLETFPDDFQDEIKKGHLPLMLLIDGSYPAKKSDVLSEAKNRGIALRNVGSLLLYRVCLLYDVFGGVGSRFSFMCPVEYLYDVENKEIVSEILSRFKISGYTVTNLSTYLGEYAFCICSGRGLGEVENPDVSLERDGVKENVLLFSKSSVKMSDYLLSRVNFDVVVPGVLKNGIMTGKALGVKGALGYLNLSNIGRLSLFPLDGSSSIIPITNENLYEVVAYYGLRTSNRENGMVTSINRVITGSSKFMGLVGNSFPLFLFDLESLWRGYTLVINGEDRVFKNKWCLSNKNVQSLLDRFEVYFSFEAKELIGVCREYYKRSGDDGLISSFEGIRNEVNDKDLDRMYYNSLMNLKKYISSEYRNLY